MMIDVEAHRYRMRRGGRQGGRRRKKQAEEERSKTSQSPALKRKS
jgi:hypothetical protein